LLALGGRVVDIASGMAETEDQLEKFMRDALTASQQALPACLPNPPVGCVLVRDGVVIARGFTQAPYQPHAEPMALQQLEGDLEDVTAFVTLEPCSFHQRTPSCAKEMIFRRVGAVYAAMLDPHPRNQGRGIALLREAGIPVMVGLLEREVRAFLGPHLHSGGSEPPIGW
jgi:pyrimidine deaminase RibD-like protein